MHVVERIEDDLGHDQPGILLVIGRNDLPGRVPRARRAQAFLVRFHVRLPVVTLAHVGLAELPVLVRLLDAGQEALPLFVLREVEEELEDPCAISMEMLLELHDGAISIPPDGPLVDQLGREVLASKDLRMHTDDEHLLVVRTVEDPDPPALWKPGCRAPEKVMLEFLGARLFEAEDLDRKSVV